MAPPDPTKPSDAPSALAIANDAPIGIFRADSTGRMTYINPALERISGVSALRALGSSWLRSAPAETRAQAEQDWHAAIAAKQNWQTEFRFKHPDGSIRIASILMAAEHDCDGAVCAFTGFVTDITQQRSAQAELRKSERLFRLLAENATDIIVRLDLDDHVTYASPAMGEVTGFSAAETRGINPISFMHPDDRAGAKERSRQLKAGEIEQSVIEYRTPHKDGHFIWAEARSRLVRNQRGEPTEVISVVRDISDHKQLQADLIIAREAERQAAAAQSRFLATMSHEIRTPISGVIGMIDLLVTSDDEVQIPRYRAALEASARTLLRVVDDVLDYSRLSSVAITLEQAPVDMLATVHSVIDLYRPAAEAKGLALGLDYRAEARHATGDATRLGQILGNLISNAIKFTDAGRIDVAVRQDQDRWTFDVIDTGMGIAADQQQSLFAAFAQADETIAGRFGGTGLGLTITRLIVEAMAGTITVESVAGEGAQFTFDVIFPPLRNEPVNDAPIEKSSNVSVLDVLVADDDEVNLLYLSRLLERMGHRVIAVEDGEAAVAAARDKRFDAILLDRHMPRRDGDAAARAIRQLARNRDSLLILVSAARGIASKEPDTPGEGFDAHLPKPVRPVLLGQILATLGGLPASDGTGDTPTTGAVDEAQCSELADLDRVLGAGAGAELERLFRSDLEQRAGILGQAIEASDLATLRDQGHAIAGGAALIGKRRIAAAAQHLETSGSDEILERALRLLERCRDYLFVQHSDPAETGPLSP